MVKSDPDAHFEKTYNFDVSDLEPQVCAPSSPENTKPLSEALGVKIDQVCIGTCTGGSIYDFREAAKILKGHKVKARTLIIPGTDEVMRQCAAEGLLQVFVDSRLQPFSALLRNLPDLEHRPSRPRRGADAPGTAQLAGSDRGGLFFLPGISGNLCGYGDRRQDR